MRDYSMGESTFVNVVRRLFSRLMNKLLQSDRFLDQNNQENIDEEEIKIVEVARIIYLKHIRVRKRSKLIFIDSREKDASNTEFFMEYGEAGQYRIQEVIGKGSYGVVASAIDMHTGVKVAIKKNNYVFEHVSDATRILREIKLLRHFTILI